MEIKKKHDVDEKFVEHMSKEVSKQIVQQVKKNIDDQLEEDFLKRKEENDRYFFS
jgi:hypothetical protein